MLQLRQLAVMVLLGIIDASPRLPVPAAIAHSSAVKRLGRSDWCRVTNWRTPETQLYRSRRILVALVLQRSYWGTLSIPHLFAPLSCELPPSATEFFRIFPGAL